MERIGTQTSPAKRPLTSEEQQLVLDNAGLVHKQAYRVASGCARKIDWNNYYRLMMDFAQDLSQAGMIGLAKAVQKFDPNRGFEFSTFAYWEIKAEISVCEETLQIRVGPRRFSREQSRNRMIFFSEFSFGHATQSDGSRADHKSLEVLNRPEFDQEKEVIAPELLALMSLVLDEREFRFVRRKVLEDKTLEAVGLQENPQISKERTRQIVARGLRKLRDSAGFMEALEARRLRRRRQEQAERDLVFTARVIA